MLQKDNGQEDVTNRQRENWILPVGMSDKSEGSTCRRRGNWVCLTVPTEVRK